MIEATILNLSRRLPHSIFFALLIVLPPIFVIGYYLQRGLFQRIVGKNILPVILVTFGLSIFIENDLLLGYGPDPRQLPVGVLPLLTFIAAIVLIFLLDAFLYRSTMGVKIRAVSDDVRAANLIGLSAKQTYAIAMGIVLVTMRSQYALWAYEPISIPRRASAGC